MGSGAGAVLEFRVVLSLAGLSVTGSELVVKEGSKSTTVAVVSAACLRGQGKTKERVRDRGREREKEREGGREIEREGEKERGPYCQGKKNKTKKKWKRSQSTNRHTV